MRRVSVLDTSGMTPADSEHQAFSISILYTGEQLALCSSRNTPWERFPFVHCLDRSCPGDDMADPLSAD
jgi:hypothetical protein